MLALQAPLDFTGHRAAYFCNDPATKRILDRPKYNRGPGVVTAATVDKEEPYQSFPKQ